MFDPYETEAEQRITDRQSQLSIPFIGAVSDVVSDAMDVALSLPGARNVVAQVDEAIRAGIGVVALPAICIETNSKFSGKAGRFTVL